MASRWLWMVVLVVACGDAEQPPPDAALPAIETATVVEPHGTRLVVRARVLSPPDDLVGTLTFRGQAYTLDAGLRLDADVSAPITGGEPVEIVWTRGTAVVGAASVATATPFQVEAITGTWAQPPVVVTWSPIGNEPLKIEVTTFALVNHSCVATIDTGAWPTSVPDTGTVSLDTRLVHLDGLGFPCTAVLSLVRERSGVVTLGAGSIASRVAVDVVGS